MSSGYFISITLDKRRANKSGYYPVRLRVFTSNPRRQKLYATPILLTTKEYSQAWESQRVRAEFRQLHDRLLEIQRHAEEIADKLEFFTFEEFEKAYLHSKDDKLQLAVHYKKKIDELKRQERLGTASTYELSERSIQVFLHATTNRKYHTLTFIDITKEWLENYEEYWVSRVGRSVTTVGIYLRNLRYLFNTAIEDGVIDRSIYPFGRRRYVIPTSKRVKKALTLEQLQQLWNAEPQTMEQQKAKDFWFLSFLCNGINIKDIALLRNKGIEGRVLMFVRAKTQNSTKQKLKPIVVYLEDAALEIVNRYRSCASNPDDLVFNIITNEDKVEIRRLRIQNFTRFVNQHIKLIARANNLPSGISTYWARHTFATLAIQNGINIAQLSESLGHSNINTTTSYLNGFEMTKKIHLSKTIVKLL